MPPADQPPPAVPTAAPLAPLSESAIADLTDAGSYSRGKTYHRQGAIFDTRRRDATLLAACRGSSGGPYAVEATLAPADAPDAALAPVREVVCTCPRGGFCKHAVALLLAWVHAPDRFEVRPPLAHLLAAKSRDELVALVELMLERAPDLEALVDLPLPRAGAATGPAASPQGAVTPAQIRRQIAPAFARADRGDWQAARDIAAELGTVRRLGDAYADAGRWADAATVYATLAAEIVAHVDEVYDDEGSIEARLADCAAGLARGLAAQATLPETDRLPADRRAALIRDLYLIWLHDMQVGGRDLAGEGPEVIARHVTPAERAEVEGWLRQDLQLGASDDPYGAGWGHRMATDFLALLREEAGATDEELLELYREAELWDTVAALLLDLSREEEATRLAARRLRNGRAFLDFAERLAARGPESRARAISLVEERLWETEGKEPHWDGEELAWLARHHAAAGHPDRALEAERRRFDLRPNRVAYAAVEAAARLPPHPEGSLPPDRWPALRRDLLARLERDQAWYDLIEIHLAAGDGPEALAALGRAERASGGHAGGDDLAARVAAAVETTHPDEALRRYHALADRAISLRGRDQYRRAAGYLARAREVYAAQRREDDWRRAIADLRAEHKALRALREELDVLGLGGTTA